LLESKLTIGHIALIWLKNAQQGSILGITSKGIFLQLNETQVVFLTNSKDFGPLNLIYEPPLPEVWQLHDKIAIQINKNRLILKNIQKDEFTASFKVWKISAAPAFSISGYEQNKRIGQAIDQLCLLKESQGFASLLPHLLTFSERDISHSLQEIWESINAIRMTLPELNLGMILPHFKPLFGYGRGLTPSGDDFVMGLIFLLNRFNHGFIPVNWLDKLNNSLLDFALQKSNSISQSLLFCASQGSADLHIQRAVDWLMNSSTPEQNQILDLASWGNSSGADLMVGAIVAIQALQMIGKGKSHEE